MSKNAPASEPTSSAARPTSLEEIRAEIDRIDDAMHALLIERSDVISDLIEIKKVQSSDEGDPARRTSAFRPAREASMMRAMIERHTGLLPLDTVESIWRVIISTFTYVQAPYEVMYARGADGLAMRDVARFHFGYTVPVVAFDASTEVLEAVGTRGDALGIIPLASEGAWWTALESDEAPNVIARLPFVDRPDHPAGQPCLVVANAPIDPEVMAARVVSLRRSVNKALPTGVDILARSAERALVSVPNATAFQALVTSWLDSVVVGSHAPIFRP